MAPERVRRGKSAVTILVVDDQETVAQSVRAMLVREGYRVPEIVTHAPEFDQALARVRPDLVVLDIDLADAASGLDLAPRIPAHVPFLFLSAHADDGTLDLARERRPSGFVVKPFEARQLTAAVEMALASRREPEGPGGVAVPDLPEIAALSAREREVLAHLVNHKRAPAIAKALFISHHTVRNHLKSIFTKLAVRSQQELLDLLTARAARRR